MQVLDDLDTILTRFLEHSYSKPQLSQCCALCAICCVLACAQVLDALASVCHWSACI
jgi:hypothetical protein